MTVMAAEAAGGEAAGSRAAAAGAASGPSRQQVRDAQRRAAQRNQQRARAQRSQQQRQRQARQKQQETIRQVTRTARQLAPSPTFHNYQGIILAEFVAAEILVAATPWAKPATPGLSPYAARDMTKLLSIGLLYFILELTAVGGQKAGRFGAWFGGLILLVVGLNEAANLATILDIFNRNPAPASQPSTPASTISGPPPASGSGS